MDNRNLFDPSEVWTDWLKQIAFLDQVDQKYLRSLVGFGYYLGSPIEKDIWRINRFKAGEKIDSLVTDYKSIVADETDFLLSELDPGKASFSLPAQVDGKYCWINTDIVRMQVDLSNMVRFGLLSNCQKICEIGGGYGQLAVGILTNNMSLSYTVIDFPQILSVVDRWVSFLDCGIKIRCYDNVESYAQFCSEPGLHLLPNTLVNRNFELDFDLGININSFCEMTEDQVKLYLNSIKCKVFYSNNRDRQPNNSQLDSLSNIFQQNCEIYPNPESYEKFETKKQVYLFGDLAAVKKIPISSIRGIVGKEMPGLGS